VDGRNVFSGQHFGLNYLIWDETLFELRYILAHVHPCLWYILAWREVDFCTDLHILEKNEFKWYFEVIKMVAIIIKLSYIGKNTEIVGEIYSEFWVIHKIHYKYLEGIQVLNDLSNS